MGILGHAAVKVRVNPPPPAPAEPVPRRLVLDWIWNVVWTATMILLRTIATVFAMVFIGPYLVGLPPLPAMIRRPGAQPTVVEVPAPYPYTTPTGGPLRIISRIRVGTALCSLFIITLIAMSIVRGPVAVELRANSFPTRYTLRDQLGNVPLGHAVAANADALSCAVVLGINVAVVEQSCKANHE